jgi:hypothetical protein
MSKLRERARAAGAECLGTTWQGIDANYSFRCGCGHEWSHDATLVSCPKCARKRSREQRRLADGLQRLQRAAQEHGGECLSERYLGHAGRASFRCAQGHTWDTAASDVLRGAWCRICADAQRGAEMVLSDGLETLRRAAASRGGQCLSSEYLGMAQRYALRCHRGHEWEATGGAIVQGRWCRLCQHEQARLTLEAAHHAARSRGGQCLSERYINAATKMTWQCDRGHVWSTCFAVIRRGCWCPDCASMAKISNRKSMARARYRPKSPAGAPLRSSTS